MNSENSSLNSVSQWSSEPEGKETSYGMWGEVKN